VGELVSEGRSAVEQLSYVDRSLIKIQGIDVDPII